jgi:hypothetical protein
MVINILAIHQEMRNIHRHDHVTIFKKNQEFKVQDEDAYTVMPLGNFFDCEIQEIVPPKNHDTIKCSHFEQDGIRTHGISLKIGNKSAETAPKTR